ncbi:hypothetical protein MTR_8g095415 [Medicago truncatula]|uniref:Uncharacterized protein n=1 Tax=Medicago truncatula TaxID=3880 RepID=A0A072TVR2_MEDTR|nr:hypothetical protein MTR_8g095415 [Medicago truncatula]
MILLFSDFSLLLVFLPFSPKTGFTALQALPLWYNSNNVRKLRVVKPINHGAKILSLGRPNGNENWFWDPIRESGLHDLVYITLSQLY